MENQITDFVAMELFKQGAEAKLYHSDFLGKRVVIKERFKKGYRHPTLDEKLTHRRTLQEIRAMARCRKLGIRTPTIYFIDYHTHRIYMEDLKDTITARDFINAELACCSESQKLAQLAHDIGTILAKLHYNNLIHGDLTTSNILIDTRNGLVTPIVIDFGLSFVSSLAEDKGVDLYVLERAIISTHPKAEGLFKAILEAYKGHFGENSMTSVISKLDEVRQRGRKRLMVG